MLEVERSQKMACREFKLGERRLPYFYGFQCEQALSDLLQAEFTDYSNVLMLIDSTVGGHARAMLDEFSVDGRSQVIPIVVDIAEKGKTVSRVGDLMERAIAAGVARNSAVVAMGGGVLGNIAGMVAALLYRGIPLVHLPTTPVAAFDAVLSAKQAVNLSQGKNLCGTFLEPSFIACDLAWLNTVSPEQMFRGAAEMAKNVLAVTPDLGELFLGALDTQTEPDRSLHALLDIGISAKEPYLAVDPKEKNEALVFEYGHTVGHALEFASGGAMSHGEAVAWGMLAAADIARELCGLPDTAWVRHRQLVSALGIRRDRLSALSVRAVKDLLRADNKRGYLRCGDDHSPMVLLEDLGRPVMSQGRPLTAVPYSLLDAVVDRLLAGEDND
jgi:3-dehydroquinate synthase/2-deoxy-scyllo-inosose synthase